MLYVKSENAFLDLDFTIRDTVIRRYAKGAVLFAFHVRTDLLKHWPRNIQNRAPANQQDLKASIAQVKDLGDGGKGTGEIWTDVQASILT